MEEADLQALDSAGYVVLDALSHARRPPGASLASPHGFVCRDGRTYWAKREAQQGLVAELVAGRLGERTGGASPSQIVRVPPEAMPDDDPPTHLIGVGVGIRHQPGMENTRNLAGLINGLLDPKKLDEAAFARVVVFQTWVGVGDTQVMVDLRNGRLLSVDHGECFGNTAQQPFVVVPMPNVPADFRPKAQYIDAALDRVEAVTDEQLLEDLARMPSGETWRSDADRRIEIGRWLAWRRDELRGVVEQWMT